MSNILFSQKVVYHPIFIDQCSGEELSDPYVMLNDSLNSYLDSSFLLNMFVLPKDGEYMMNFSQEAIRVSVYKDSSGYATDTFYYPRLIVVCNFSPPISSKFVVCDSIANGHIVDYYYNGNIRMKGSFKNGLPVDTVFSYYRRGELMGECIYNDKRSEFTYYRNGQLALVKNIAKQIAIFYYPSGQILRTNKITKRYFLKSREYYEDGTVKAYTRKKKKMQFDSKGQTIEKLKCRRVYYPFYVFVFSKKEGRAFVPMCKFKWVTYDSLLNVKRKVVIVSNSRAFDQIPPSLSSIIRYDDLDQITYYKNGKKFKRLEFKWVGENKDYQRKLFVYKRVGRKWVKVSEYVNVDQKKLEEIIM